MRTTLTGQSPGWTSNDDDVIMDGYYDIKDNDGNQRQLMSRDYLNPSDLDIDNALSDRDIDVYRDSRECRYAFEVFREHIRKPIMVHKRGLSNKAERWAVYLASRLGRQDKEKNGKNNWFLIKSRNVVYCFAFGKCVLVLVLF